MVFENINHMNLQELRPPITILLVEDNPGDVFLISRCLSNSQFNHKIYHVEDGEQAMSFLHHEGEYATKPSPHIVLLDLNLPLKSGLEVLEEMKADLNLKHLPVIILTSSRAEEDIFNSYQLYANCYIAKPFEVDEFAEVINAIEVFWAKCAQLPVVS